MAIQSFVQAVSEMGWGADINHWGKSEDIDRDRK